MATSDAKKSTHERISRIGERLGSLSQHESTDIKKILSVYEAL